MFSIGVFLRGNVPREGATLDRLFDLVVKTGYKGTPTDLEGALKMGEYHFDGRRWRSHISSAFLRPAYYS